MLIQSSICNTTCKHKTHLQRVVLSKKKKKKKKKALDMKKEGRLELEAQGGLYRDC